MPCPYSRSSELLSWKPCGATQQTGGGTGHGRHSARHGCPEARWGRPNSDCRLPCRDAPQQSLRPCLQPKLHEGWCQRLELRAARAAGRALADAIEQQAGGLGSAAAAGKERGCGGGQEVLQHGQHGACGEEEPRHSTRGWWRKRLPPGLDWVRLPPAQLARGVAVPLRSHHGAGKAIWRADTAAYGPPMYGSKSFPAAATTDASADSASSWQAGAARACAQQGPWLGSQARGAARLESQSGPVPSR
jgi:hypothetical protein